MVDYTSKFTVITVNINRVYTLNESVGPVQSINRKTLYCHELNDGISIELFGNMIIKKKYHVDRMICSELGSINFTRPIRIYDLGNISFWPDASLLVFHGADLFR